MCNTDENSYMDGWRVLSEELEDHTLTRTQQSTMKQNDDNRMKLLIEFTFLIDKILKNDHIYFHQSLQ